MKKVNIDKGYNIYKLSNGVRISVFRCRSVMVYTDYNDKVATGIVLNGEFITDKGLLYGKTTLQELYNMVK